jgi:hypothetical protein
LVNIAICLAVLAAALIVESFTDGVVPVIAVFVVGAILIFVRYEYLGSHGD